MFHYSVIPGSISSGGEVRQCVLKGLLCLHSGGWEDRAVQMGDGAFIITHHLPVIMFPLGEH